MIIIKLALVLAVVCFAQGLMLDELSKYPDEFISYLEAPLGVRGTSPAVGSGHYPIVRHEQLAWYKNWLTCSICQGWVQTFATLAQKSYYVKALKGFLWLSCAGQFSQSFCKAEVGSAVDQMLLNAFDLMLSQNFICGYITDLCGETSSDVYFTQDTVAAYQATVLADKPASVASNTYLDFLYELSPPEFSPPTFSVLWLSDIELDLAYTTGSNVNCRDDSCCHAGDTATFDNEKAPQYGTTKCYHSLDGYKKMIDSLNSLNTSSWANIKSIIYTGGSAAQAPGYVTEARTTEASQEIIKYLREKNPQVGIYYSLGTSDLYPHKYQDFGSAGATNLSNYDSAANVDTAADSYSSVSSDSTARSKFNQYGYYKMENVIYSILPDNSNPDWAGTGIASQHISAIFINTNACYNNNWALMKEKGDPGGQLAYLATELAAVEASTGRRAWIIGNIAPGNRHCNTRWAQRYNALIERYQKIVVFQGFGYDEKEYFQLQYPVQGARHPFGVTFQGGKATSLGQSPRFKIIDFDTNYEIPQRMTIYQYDIEKAAADPSAEPISLFQKVRQYPADLGMGSMRPADFAALIVRIKNTESEAVNYINAMCPKEDCKVTACDATCRKDLGCMLENSSQQEVVECRGYGIRDAEYGLDYLISQTQNPWVTQQSKP